MKKGCNWGLVCRKCRKSHGPVPMLGKTGWHHTKETKRKIGVGVTGEKNGMFGRTGRLCPSYGRTGSLSPNYGKKFTEEHKKKIGIAHTGEKNGFFGKHHTEETKELIRRANTGENSPRYGKTGSLATMYGRSPTNSGYGKGGKRKDLDNQYFRSTWEPNFARFLNLINVKWQYEPKDKRCYFIKEGITYMPDFYLPKEDLYIEITGRIDDDKKRNLELFKQYYPERELVHIIGDVWFKYFYPYKYIIENWEK